MKNTTEAIRRKKGLSIIIPAAGTGTRMKAYGPKPLIKIGNQSIISRQIEILKSCFYCPEIVVVSGYESCKVMNNLPRNIVKVENEFQTIRYVSDQGKVVCLPILHLTKEIPILEKQSPKLAGYVKKRLQSLGLKKNI